MPRRNKVGDLDFQIHVDPSCLSDSMDDNEHEGLEELQTMTTNDKVNDAEIELDTEPDTAPKTGVSEPTAGPDVEHKVEPEAQSQLEEDKLAELNVEDEDEKPQTVPEPEPQLQDAQDITPDTPQVESEKSTEPESEPEPAAPASDEPAGVLQKKDSNCTDSTIQQADQEEESAQEISHHSETDSNPPDSRRESSVSSGSYEFDRRHSGRTEALIQKAARDIIAQIGDGEQRDSLDSIPGTEESSYLSHSDSASQRPSDAHMSVAGRSQVSTEDGARSGFDEANDSSSHHEHEDDVFSDHSPRSSMGSMPEGDKKKAEETIDRLSRSPRISGVSEVSGYSQISEYDREDDFVPTIRGTPRPAFRSPSSVKALQMSSPPASVLGSPRSSTRVYRPTMSRLGSPRFSTQHSPKKTPPRFKRATPPLVLLHVTLLPLRWPWGDVLENAETEDLSSEAKTIRDAWRQLQDRMGDTTVERGILLPHPQSDYEILEERLFEALELPMRRRARILECGHYLGPSNEWSLTEDSESEEDGSDGEDDDLRRSSRRSQQQKPRIHWCKTCRSDIQYESLGPGKIFRVKVYASNGLMRGGAWEACWKEMERVDVEIEPLVDAISQEELVRLEAEQERELAMREAEEEERYARLEQEEREFEELERGRDRMERSSHLSEHGHHDEGESYLEEHEAHDQSARESLDKYAEEHEDADAGNMTATSVNHHVDDEAEAHIGDITREPDVSVAKSVADEEHTDIHADDIARDVTEDDMDPIDRNKSLEQLEKELDEHLSENSGATDHDKSQFSDLQPQPTAEPESSYVEHVGAESRAAASPPTPSAAPFANPEADHEDRQKLEEERLREIYGETPNSGEHQHYEERRQSSAPNTSDHLCDSSNDHTFKQHKTMKNASLPELLMESARVLMQDKKNIMIGLLSLLILMLALKGNSGPPQDPRLFQTLVANAEASTVTVTEAAIMETATGEAIGQATSSCEAMVDDIYETVAFQALNAEVNQPVENPAHEEDKKMVADEHQIIGDLMAVEGSYSPETYSATSASGSVDPCASCTLSSVQQARPSVSGVANVDTVGQEAQRRETETETETIRIVQTVTAVETATVRVTETATEIIVERQTQGAQPSEGDPAEAGDVAIEDFNASAVEASLSEGPVLPENGITPVKDGRDLFARMEEVSELMMEDGFGTESEEL